MRRIWLLAAMVALVGISLATLGAIGLAFTPVTASNGTNWVHVAVFFGLMIVGMLAREAYNAIMDAAKFNWR